MIYVAKLKIKICNFLHILSYSIPNAHVFENKILNSNMNILSSIFTWKNIVRGISVSIFAMLIRKGIYLLFDIDILTYFLINNFWTSYITTFMYFSINFFAGLSVGEIFNHLCIKYIKENIRFLGLPLGLELPKSKLYLDGVEEVCKTNIKVIDPVNVNIASRDPSSPNNSTPSTPNSGQSHRSLSPFSRPATPVLRPDLGPQDTSVRMQNDPDTVITCPSDITNPDYFRRPFDHTSVYSILDTVITELLRIVCRESNYEIRGRDNTTGLFFYPFGWSTLLSSETNTHSFYSWQNITNVDQCSEVLLRSMIARLEFSRWQLVTNTNYSTTHTEDRIDKINILLAEAKRSLSSRFR